jgi:hypothetical protein
MVARPSVKEGMTLTNCETIFDTPIQFGVHLKSKLALGMLAPISGPMGLGHETGAALPGDESGPILHPFILNRPA